MNQNASAMQMANAIFGNGVTVVGASYSGSSYASATYSGGNSTSPGVVPGDTGVILSTGRVGWFTNSSGDPNRASNTSYNTGGQDNTSDFNAIASARTYHASYLTTTFIPDSNVMTITFIVSSEEYPEYSNSVYNDVVGVWANGVHIPVSVTASPAAVSEINQTENINLYHDNTGDQFNTEMDGFTVTMTLTIPVRAGQVNRLKIGIADTSDSNYDSNLLIAGDSVQTKLIAIQDDFTLHEGETATVNVLGNDINHTGVTLVVTHINGVPVVAGNTVVLPSGHSVKLNADDTFDFTTVDDEGKASFTYATESVGTNGQTLQTDTGFVTVDTIPCFVAGTLFRTPQGCVPVETLAALLFGVEDVLVAARDLVNDLTIRACPGGAVTYVHLLFDRHQVICSQGLATESFLPGPQMTKAFERDAMEEIGQIFPDLDWDTGDGYSPAARRRLKRYEAQVLRQAAA